MAAADPATAVEIPLRDIHMSVVGHWWPPAPGWWVLTAILSLILIGLIVRLMRYRQRQRDYLMLSAELDQIEHRLKGSKDKAAYVRDLSRLLRRICRYRSSQPELVSEHGHAWAEFLSDGHSMDSDLGKAATMLATQVYQAQPVLDHPHTLSDLVDYWLRKVSRIDSAAHKTHSRTSRGTRS